MARKKKDGLTKRQEDILIFIKKFMAEHGFPPSIREIGDGTGLSSPATVFVHLKNLEEKGVIKQTDRKFRTIELLVDNEYADKKNNVVKLPLLGKISAGNPIDAIENADEYFSVPYEMIDEDTENFVLQVKGDSMVNKGIFNKDYVVVRRQEFARNGDIVVAMTENNQVTIKTFYKENKQIRLQPENDAYDPIILDDVVILGKVIGLYRKISK